MSPLDRHRWSVIRVLRDWKERKTEKPRNVLPTKTTSSRRFIKRLRDRVSYRQTGKIKDDISLIAQELDAERNKVTNELIERGRGRIERSPFINDEDKKWLLATNFPQQES